MNNCQTPIRTPFAKYDPSPIVDKYKQVAISMLRYNFPLLTEAELAAAVDNSISNHLQQTPARINNNYKNRTVEMTVQKIADYIISREPITTSYGVLFNRHGVVPNPLYGVIDGFIKNRKVLKKEMFKYPKGSEMFEKYNLLQLLSKIDANG